MNLFRIKKIFAVAGIVYLCGATLPALAVNQNERTLPDVINQVLTNYPSLRIARLEIERARQEFAKVDSQLGWIVNAQTGISRDVGIFNIPSERFDAAASIGSVQKSGNSVEITGEYAYEESDSSVIPAITNPTERTRLDLNYRIPFGQGEDNPAYSQGMESADAGLQATEATRTREINALVRQTLSLFYDSANTYTRIKDAEEAINRARRLLRFINSNKKLGLVDKKDVLNAEALLSGKIADRDALLVVWSRQRSALNRLVGVKPNSDFIPVIVADSNIPQRSVALEMVYSSDPDIKLQMAQLKSAKAGLELANDAKKDKLDLVLSVGARNTSGDTAFGTVDDNEWAGGARLEYRFSTDQQGFDAEIYQAMLDIETIQKDLDRIKRDLDYEVTGLLDQIEKNRVSETSSKRNLSIEKQKVEEAIKRYQVGRADTKELIDNENTLFASNLLYKNRKIELARKYSELELLMGRLWDRKLLLNGQHDNN